MSDLRSESFKNIYFVEKQQAVAFTSQRNSIISIHMFEYLWKGVGSINDNYDDDDVDEER